MAVALEEILFSETNDTENITQPHDKFFRTVMSDKRVARAFLEKHLPENILEVTHLDNLEIQPRSFINDMRKETTVDLLFKTTMNAEDAFIYLLIEHQSTPDELMAFRILKYTVNILSDYLDRTKNKKLPLIYPMVVYHGWQSYSYATDIRDIVDAPRDLVDRYFLQPFHLIDMNKIEDAEIKKHAWAGLMEFALKHIYERDVLPWVKEFAYLMRRITEEGGEKYVEIVLEYLMTTGQLSSEDEYISLIDREISKKIGDKMMSLADKIRFEGRQEGREEGREEGQLEGLQKAALALPLLMQNENVAVIARKTGLPVEKVELLKNSMAHCAL